MSEYFFQKVLLCTMQYWPLIWPCNESRLWNGGIVCPMCPNLHWSPVLFSLFSWKKCMVKKYRQVLGANRSEFRSLFLHSEPRANYLAFSVSGPHLYRSGLKQTYLLLVLATLYLTSSLHILSVCVIFFLQNEDSNCTFLMRLNELTHVQFLEKCF